MEIGAGNIPKAKSYYNVNIHVAAVFVVLSITLFIRFNAEVVSVFTNLENVQIACDEVLPYFSIGLFPDAW